jgi:type VI secretion system protein ImpG
MFDYLLPYFNRELDSLRRLAAGFAEAHPKIAGRLRLSGHAVDDPHVERLLEGVAFLNARVHHRLDDDFPELTDALLGVLYPHYLAPIPSAAIAAFEAVPDLRSPVRLEPGLELDTEPVRGETCRFRTAAPLTLWPVRVELARLQGMPIAAPPNPQAAGAAAVLRIALTCLAPEMTFAELGVDRLRFFLRGAAGVSQSLYHLLCGHALSVAYADGPTDPSPLIVPPTAIVPGGFAPDEALWPWPARSFSGFR